MWFSRNIRKLPGTCNLFRCALAVRVSLVVSVVGGHFLDRAILRAVELERQTGVISDGRFQKVIRLGGEFNQLGDGFTFQHIPLRLIHQSIDCFGATPTAVDPSLFTGMGQRLGGEGSDGGIDSQVAGELEQLIPKVASFPIRRGE